MHKSLEINTAKQENPGGLLEASVTKGIEETLAAIKLAREYNWKIVVSHRGRETNDDFIADLAWGIGADGIKLGAPARGERVAKYNRLLEIEATGN